MHWESDYLYPSSILTPPLTHERIIVLLIRHGRSSFNEQGRYQGDSDESVLTSKGETMAQLTGAYLRQLSVPISGVYSSPLQRAKQTATQIINELDLPLPIRLEPRLKEINLAHWQGLPYETVKQNYSKEYTCWQKTPHLFDPEQPDRMLSKHPPLITLHQQAREFWHQFLCHHQRGCLLVISHSGTIRALISTLIGIHPQDHHKIQQSNCGISALEIDPNHDCHAKLRLMNSTHHLNEVLPKLKAGKVGLRLLLIPKSSMSHSDWIIRQIQSVTIDFTLDLPLYDLSEPDGDQGSELGFVPKRLAEYYRHHQADGLSENRPVTGLVIAPSVQILSLVSCCFESGSQLDGLLPLDGLSVIHYPSLDQRPILQGLNLFGSALLRERNTLQFGFHSNF